MNGLFNDKILTVREVMKSMLDFWLRGTYELYDTGDDRDQDNKNSQAKTEKKSEFSSSNYRNKKGKGKSGDADNACYTSEYAYDVEEAKEAEEEEVFLPEKDGISSTNAHVLTHGEYTDDECDGQLLYRQKKKRPKKSKCCEHHDEEDPSSLDVRQTDPHSIRVDDR